MFFNNETQPSKHAASEHKAQGFDAVQAFVEQIDKSQESLLEASNGSSFVFFGNRFDPRQSVEPDTPIHYALVVDNDLSAAEVLEQQQKINDYLAQTLKVSARCDASILQNNIAYNAELAKKGEETVWDTLGISQNPQFHLMGKDKNNIHASLLAAIQAYQKKQKSV